MINVYNTYCSLFTTNSSNPYTATIKNVLLQKHDVLGVLTCDCTANGYFIWKGAYLWPIYNELRVIWPVPHEILSVITRSTIIT